MKCGKICQWKQSISMHHLDPDKLEIRKPLDDK